MKPEYISLQFTITIRTLKISPIHVVIDICSQFTAEFSDMNVFKYTIATFHYCFELWRDLIRVHIIMN